MHNEGYVFIATGDNKYIRQAIDAASSIRYYDKERDICLIFDKDTKPTQEQLNRFDSYIVLRKQLIGTENHLYLNRLSPFERTLYVDSDCLATNPKLNPIWEEFQRYPVAFPGEKINSGVWRMNIKAILKRFKIEYVVRLNGGVFYFDKSKDSERFFSIAQGIFEKKVPEVLLKHINGGGYANEPIWGSSLAISELPIFPITHDLNVSTKKTKAWGITSEPSVVIEKEGSTHNPIFSHFLGMNNKVYRLSNLYRAFLEVIKD